MPHNIIVSRRKATKYNRLATLVGCAIMFLLLSINPVYDSHFENRDQNLGATAENTELSPKTADLINPNITQSHSPLVINMKEYPQIYNELAGLDYTNIRVAYYDADSNWLLVPYQIDEVGKPVRWQYNGSHMVLKNDTDFYLPFGDPYGLGYDTDKDNNLVTAGNIDSNDELTFYIYNGRKTHTKYWWNQTYYPYRIEVKFIDPFDGGIAWMYIYYNNVTSYESATSNAWYQNYVQYDAANRKIWSDVYNYTLKSTNYDTATELRISIGDADGANLIAEDRKSFGHGHFYHPAVPLYGIPEINQPLALDQDGTWPSGYDTPGTYNTMKTSLDDPSDAYNSNEGNLQNTPSRTNNIEGAGDHNAVIDGPCRVILYQPQYEHWEYSSNTLKEYYRETVMYFYYNMTEERVPELKIMPITEFAGNPLPSPETSFYYYFTNIVELNTAIRTDLSVYYGATASNPNYGAGIYSTGLVTANPDGTSTNDVYASGGDPTDRSSPYTLPNNPEIPDWFLLASDDPANHGSIWRNVYRTGYAANPSVNNIQEINWYWRDTATNTEFGIEFEVGSLSVGVTVPEHWLRTTYTDETIGSSNVYNKGNETYEKFMNSRVGSNASINTALISLITLEEPFTGNPFAPSLFEQPPDVSYLTGDASLHMVSWTFSDPDPSYYNITRNGGLVAGPSVWQSDVAIEYDVGGLAEGVYTFVISANNTGNNATTDTVIVTVSSFSINHPADVTAPIKTLGLTIDWVITGSNAPSPTWEFYFENVLTDWGTWVSGEPISISLNDVFDNTILGTYTYKMNATDGLGNNLIDEVTVTVINDVPQITQPANRYYVLGEVTSPLIWQVYDNYLHPSNARYYIYNNSVLQKQGQWLSGNNLFVYLTGLGEGVYNFTIIVDDFMGATNSDTVWVTVTTNYPPVISQPADLFYMYNSMGNTIYWTVTDALSKAPRTYEVTRNGSAHASSTWVNDTAFGINVDNLNPGYYQFIITANDGYGLTAQDTVWVTVNDYMDITRPADVFYVEGTVNNKIDWVITDIINSGRFYAVSYNRTGGDNWITGSYTSGATLSINIDGFDPGFYNFSIIASDGYGQSIWDYVIVTVNDLIQINHPNDILYLSGSSGNIIPWIITDVVSATRSFTIHHNGTGGTNWRLGTWVSGVALNINVDGFGAGFWKFTIIAQDGYGSTVEDEVIVIVNDVPGITSPADKTYQQGSTGNTLSWVVTDNVANSRQYVVSHNQTGGSNYAQGTWASGTPITINIDGLSPGYYNFSITVTDGFGGSVLDWVIVTVNDVPSITQPANLEYVYGDLGNIISWMPTDLMTGTRSFNVYRDQDGGPWDSGSWTTGNPIMVNVDGLDPGVYLFNITIFDGLGGSKSDTVYVSVNDIPLISPVANFAYQVGTSGHMFSWIITDTYSNTRTYTVNSNVTGVWQSGSWSNGVPMNVNPDGLPLGVYNFSIEVNDGRGGIGRAYVIITVQDVAGPFLVNAPDDLVLSLGYSGVWLNWTWSDYSAGFYNITELGTYPIVNQSGIWSSYISINFSIDGLPEGTYNFTIWINDTYGNWAFHTVNVSITAAPMALNSPSNIYYVVGSAGSYVIRWTATTSGPTDLFVLYIDDIFEISGGWTSGVAIEFDVSGWAYGSYKVVCVVNLTNGQELNDTVYVYVTNDIPGISQPADDLIIEGAIGNYIDWMPSDIASNNPTYSVKRSGLGGFYDSGVWTSGVQISVNIDGLAPGVYNFTITIDDGLGGIKSSSVFITVNDMPKINTPSNIVYLEGATGNAIPWIATDMINLVRNYLVEHDQAGGLIYMEGTWTSGVNLNIPIDGLAPGIYQFNITITDGYGGSVVDIVVVTVNDIPLITEPGDFSYTEGITGNSISWTVSDTYSSTRLYSVTRGGSIYVSNLWTSGIAIVVPVDNMPAGVYTFIITATDGLGGSVQDTIIVTVTPNDTPVITNPSNVFYTHGTTGNQIIWVVNDTVSTTRTYIVTRNGYPHASGAWNSEESIVINIDGLTDGYYTFQITANDGLNKQVQDSVLVTVNGNPTIIATSLIYYLEGTTSNTLSFTVVDTVFGTRAYIVSHNHTGGLNFGQGNWNSGVAVAVNIDNLDAGYYNFTITVNDGLGGEKLHYILLLVNDLPGISNPDNMTFVAGTTGNTLSWLVLDGIYEECTYFVRMNNYASFYAIGVYVPGEPITISLDSLEAGEYTFTITIDDGYGGSITDTVKVTVQAKPIEQPEEKPPFTLTPTMITLGLVGVMALSVLLSKTKKKGGSKGGESGKPNTRPSGGKHLRGASGANTNPPNSGGPVYNTPTPPPQTRRPPNSKQVPKGKYNKYFKNP